LRKRIDEKIAKHSEATIFDRDLDRLWPVTMPYVARKRAIQQFAKDHGYKVYVYQIGTCAVFKKLKSLKR